jgi:hypothetical protein
MTSERVPPRIGLQSLRGHAFRRQAEGSRRGGSLLVRVLLLVPLVVPLAPVLLHIGPGVVVDVTLFVSVFALLQVGVLRSALLGA